MAGFLESSRSGETATQPVSRADRVDPRIINEGPADEVSQLGDAPSLGARWKFDAPGDECARYTRRNVTDNSNVPRESPLCKSD